MQRKKGAAIEGKNTLPSVKHGGGIFCLWCGGRWCRKPCTENGFRQISANSVNANVAEFVEKGKPKRVWLLQQGNDAKETSKSTASYFSRRKRKQVERPSPSSDFCGDEHMPYACKTA